MRITVAHGGNHQEKEGGKTAKTGGEVSFSP